MAGPSSASGEPYHHHGRGQFRGDTACGEDSMAEKMDDGRGRFGAASYLS